MVSNRLLRGYGGPLVAGNTHSIDFELDSSQHAYCVDNADVSVTGDITIECGIKPETLSTAGLVTKYDYGAGDRDYSFDLYSTGKLTFTVTDDGSYTDGHRLIFRTDNNVISTGSWFHTAVSFDISSETCVFYVDGSSVASSLVLGTNIGATIHDGGSRFGIGCIFNSNTAVSFYDGKIDDARLWNDVRTSTEINNNKSVELTGNEANLAGYWKLNNNYTDACKSSDLTGVGTPVFSTDTPF